MCPYAQEVGSFCACNAVASSSGRSVGNALPRALVNHRMLTSV